MCDMEWPRDEIASSPRLKGKGKFSTPNEPEPGTSDGNSGKRQLRKRKLNLNSLAEGLTGDGLTCQVSSCGVKVKDSRALEWHYEGHYAQELEKLGRIRVTDPSSTNRRGRKPAGIDTPSQLPAVEEDPTRLRRVRDSAVDRIRLDREKRKHRINNGSGSGGEDSGGTSSSLPKCPSCSSEVDDVDLVEHLEVCLKTPEEAKRSLIEGEEGDDGEDLDVDGDGGGYETYTWAGHTRIRATSLVDGGLRGAGFMTITKGDENAVLDIENEDWSSASKGSAQYTDADVIVPVSESAKEKEERENLRQVLIGGPEGEQACKSTDPEDSNGNDGGDADEDNSTASLKPPEQMNVLELRQALAESRKENAKLRQQVLCNICFDSYTKPVVSVVCWHVHCETCWLRALGTKKLCPQCKIIIQPRDLRRVYL